MLTTPITISHKASLRQALEQFNQLAPAAIVYTTLFVTNEKKQIMGALTDGDLRRAILDGITLTDPVIKAANTHFKFFSDANYSSKYLHELHQKKIRFVPYLNANKTLRKIVDLEKLKAIVPVEAVIMAGGKGERLRPLTQDTPKPMLKVGGKPILEINIDRMASFGIHTIHLSVNYLKEKIINYFDDGKKRDLNISYLVEDKPLGTIGSLTLAKGFESDYILLQNGDLLTNIDYEEFYNHCITSRSDLAVATIPYLVDIPYAVMEFDSKSLVTGLREKPRLTYQSNAGIYMIHKKLLKYIPKNEIFNATDLISVAVEKKHKVSSFPIVGYWTDIGRMEDFQKVQGDIRLLQQ